MLVPFVTEPLHHPVEVIWNHSVMFEEAVRVDLVAFSGTLVQTGGVKLLVNHAE